MVNSGTATTNTITTTIVNPATTTIYWQFWILWLKCMPKDFLF